VHRSRAFRVAVPSAVAILFSQLAMGVAHADTSPSTDPVLQAATADTMPSLSGLDNGQLSVDMQTLIGSTTATGQAFLAALSNQEQSVLLWSLYHSSSATSVSTPNARTADDPCAVLIVDNCFATIPTDLAEAAAALTGVSTPSPVVSPGPGDPTALLPPFGGATDAAATRRNYCTDNKAQQVVRSAGPSFLQYTILKQSVQAQWCYTYGRNITSINVTNSLDYCVFFVDCSKEPLLRQQFYPGNEVIEADYSTIDSSFVAHGVPIHKQNTLEEEETNTGYYAAFTGTHP